MQGKGSNIDALFRLLSAGVKSTGSAKCVLISTSLNFNKLDAWFEVSYFSCLIILDPLWEIAAINSDIRCLARG